MNTRKKFVCLIMLMMVFSCAIIAAEQNKGAADLMLNGGTRGNVPFPHQKHQANLDNCNVCHDIFPQSPGIIDDLKTQGKLKKKQVMNKLCTKCHKAEKKAGKKYGPITCSQCHVK